MVEFSYQEPVYLALGQKMYEHFLTNKEKGNAVSILSDAMTVLRQLGTAGLNLWIDAKNAERGFIRDTLDKQKEIANRLGLSSRLTLPEAQDIDTAWSDIENLMRVLRYAKYYAKTREKQEEND
ncbi:MAG: hypothetical protein D3903_22475 [Candidatus Electrothrix sp. GM3_4]|nr:hypothetical protein [Candidatus Electrothrix sp. GM3_4]